MMRSSLIVELVVVIVVVGVADADAFASSYEKAGASFEISRQNLLLSSATASLLSEPMNLSCRPKSAVCDPFIHAANTITCLILRTPMVLAPR